MQFPYNPLTMRMLSSTPPTSMACPSPSMQSQQQTQGGTPGPVAPTRAWEREPPLLSEQYETLSDSDDWARLPAFLIWRTPSHSSYYCPSLSLFYWIPLTATRVRFNWEGGRPLGATFVPTGGQEKSIAEGRWLSGLDLQKLGFVACLGMRTTTNPKSIEMWKERMKNL